jgi:fructokinase
VTRVCDPNLRLSLWENSQAALQGIELALSRADVVKMSVEELEFIIGEPDPLEALGGLSGSPDRLVVVTAGSAGCFYRARGMVQHVPGFAVEVVDTTGAGDAFLAAMIAGLLQHGFSAELDVLKGILRAANAAGALACTRKGAIPALPSRHQLDEFLSSTAPPAMR